MRLKEALDKRKQTFYHASPKRLKVGTILTPNRGNFEKSWQHHAVFLTTKPLPHFTIMKHAVRENWHVYIVEPLSKIEKGIWDDLETDSARVLKYVGKARGIVDNHKRKTKFDKRAKTYQKNMSKEYPEDDWSDEYPTLGSSVGRGVYRKMKKKS